MVARGLSVKRIIYWLLGLMRRVRFVPAPADGLQEQGCVGTKKIGWRWFF